MPFCFEASLRDRESIISSVPMTTVPLSHSHTNSSTQTFPDTGRGAGNQKWGCSNSYPLVLRQRNHVKHKASIPYKMSYYIWPRMGKLSKLQLKKWELYYAHSPKIIKTSMYCLTDKKIGLMKKQFYTQTFGHESSISCKLSRAVLQKHQTPWGT